MVGILPQDVAKSDSDASNLSSFSEHGYTGQILDLQFLWRIKMKKTAIWCVLSAILGGLASFEWRNMSSLDAPSAAKAQEASPGQSSNLASPPSPAPLPSTISVAAPGAAASANSLTAEEQVNVFVYQQANRSVVNIDTESVVGERFLMFEAIAKGEGSGIVIDRDGRILTNFHVVDGAKEIRVTLFDGNTYNGKLVGGDPDTDIAVLKVDAPANSLFPVEFGSSTNLLVGQRVFAIGNPFGLERTLSTGIISSLDRSLPSRTGRRSMKSIIQIDASINPGSSGGPLLDTHARVIGMNTAIASKSGESVGVGFAIPINTISRVVPLLIRNGRIRRPDTGIAKVYQTDRGLLVASLVHNGPAERAGLHGPLIRKEQKRQGPFVYETTTIDRAAADLIVAVDDHPIKTADDFLNVVESKQPGDQVTITVIRGGQEQQIPLRLETAN
jgi:S1-C subfamily serine protease